MRYPNPERNNRQFCIVKSIVQGTDDAGRALIAGPVQSQSVRQVRVCRAALYRGRARVRYACDHRSERDHHFTPRVTRDLYN